jgi:hypothetical protein
MDLDGLESAVSSYERETALLSHLGGPQPQKHRGVGRILFATAEEIGQGFALEQAQLHQAQDGLDAHRRT